MKNLVTLILIISLFTILSCTQKPDYGQPNIDFNSLEKDFNKWWSYHNNNILLSSDFIPLDEHSNKLSKDEFLKNLITGFYVPLKLKSKDSLIYYKLFRLDKIAVDEIRKTIIASSSHSYDLFKMEGKYFPTFNFTDLKGEVFNNENTKGKFVILKCWFVGCHACIAEFPELNNLVEKYQNRNDIIFISLALDSQENLDQFLINKPFKFAVIPSQEEYITKILNISQYPTLFIIDKNGVIEKVVNNSSEMILALEKLNL
jgi:thiol-disulfide isomerase/thioredoxin